MDNSEFIFLISSSTALFFLSDFTLFSWIQWTLRLLLTIFVRTPVASLPPPLSRLLLTRLANPQFLMNFQAFAAVAYSQTTLLALVVVCLLIAPYTTCILVLPLLPLVLPIWPRVLLPITWTTFPSFGHWQERLEYQATQFPHVPRPVQLRVDGVGFSLLFPYTSLRQVLKILSLGKLSPDSGPLVRIGVPHSVSIAFREDQFCVRVPRASGALVDARVLALIRHANFSRGEVAPLIPIYTTSSYTILQTFWETMWVPRLFCVIAPLIMLLLSPTSWVATLLVLHITTFVPYATFPWVLTAIGLAL